jgi:hypothetical protein
MKKLLTPLLLLFVAASCQAQESHLDQFYHKYDGSGGSESVSGTINLALLLNLSSSDKSGKSDTANSWISKVTMCRFIVIDPEKGPKAGAEWNDLQQSVKDDHFEECMTVRQGKDNFRMMILERKDGQEDLVCLATGQHSGGVFFHVRGRFSAADRAKIGAALRDRES